MIRLPWKRQAPPALPDLRGRVCLVTGATSGIGLATALGLRRRGATVLLGCRTREKGEETLKILEAEPGEGGLELFVCDLGNLQQVRDSSAELSRRINTLHVLIHNAGVLDFAPAMTVDGWESHWGINHLAPFLLTSRLLPLLKSSAPSRVVVVTSARHAAARPQWDGVRGNTGMRFLAAYNRSKLANVMFTYALARRLEGSGVTANCLHPGGVATGLGHSPAWIRPLLRLLLASPATGARTSLLLAGSPDLEGVNGCYFSSGKAVPSSEASYRVADQEKLWSESRAMVGED